MAFNIIQLGRYDVVHFMLYFRTRLYSDEPPPYDEVAGPDVGNDIGLLSESNFERQTELDFSIEDCRFMEPPPSYEECFSNPRL